MLFSRSRNILDHIPEEFRKKFITAGHIKQLRGEMATKKFIPEELTMNKEVDQDFQVKVQAEVARRIALLNENNKSLNFMPAVIRPGDAQCPTYPLARKLFEVQQDILEMDNRIPPDKYEPLARNDMMPFTPAIHASRKNTDSKIAPLFSSEEDFLKAFDEGLKIWKKGSDGFGTVGVLDVGGGAGARAARDLAMQPFQRIAYENHVSAETPRSLYPILGTEHTFKGRVIDIVKTISKSLGVRTPIFSMISSEKASYFLNHIQSNKIDVASWDEDVVLWNQRILKRYDIESFPKELAEGFPAGHGDAAILGFRYGIYKAMKDLGIKYVANSNGDEFLWYYLFPALLGKMGPLEATMFMMAVPNILDQSGGCFSGGLQMETPRIPYLFVNAGNPETLNTTFTVMTLNNLLEGAGKLEEEAGENVTLTVKPTWWNMEGTKEYMNIIGHESWMGEVFSQQNQAGGGTMKVLEAPRNLFLGIKGASQAFNDAPQDFLVAKGPQGDRNLSYVDFYGMMANKVIKVLNLLLAGKSSERNVLAKDLFDNNFELINVNI